MLNYYHFCGTFYGLKWRIWRAKRHFDPLKYANEKRESNNKQPIKIEKPLQFLLPFTYRVVQRNTFQTILLQNFSVFIS